MLALTAECVACGLLTCGWRVAGVSLTYAQSLEEIRKQQAEGVALYEQRPRMAELLRQAEEKSRLLRQTGSSSLDLVQGTQLLEVMDNCPSCISSFLI